MIDFGTGGFRGVIGETFTKDTIQKITQALANIINKEGSNKPIVVGYDYRFLSDRAAIWVAEVLAGNGINVLLSKSATPTPAVMYMTKHLDNDYGAMITASHNPYQFNGIKVFQKQGMDADVVLTNKIEAEIVSLSEIKVIPSYEAEYKTYVKEIDILDDYLDNIKNFISPDIKGRKTKILFDAIHGTGAISLSKIAQDYELENFVTINGTHDTMFGGKMPNPTPDAMLKNKERVIEEGFDFAIGIDCDGDRLALLDENGNYVENNEILAALYYYLVKYKNEKGDCVKNCATSNLVDKVVLRFGYKCHEVDVGFKNISSKLKEVDALVGGESSGGLTIRNYIFGKDSTFAAMLFIEMVSVMNKKVSEIIKEVRDFAEFHHKIVEHTIHYQANLDIKRYLLDVEPNFTDKPIEVRKFGKNVKYIFPNDEWVIFRLSGTEPVLRIFVEMETSDKTYQYLETVYNYINNIDKEEYTLC